MNDFKELRQRLSDGFEKAKAGDALTVYAETAPLHDSGNLPDACHYPFGWIIYYALHQSRREDTENRKRMLHRYLKLNLEKPHKLHSMVLTEAMRLAKDVKDLSFGKREIDAPNFSLLKFMNIWGWDNLRGGDWRRKEHEGKTLSSTAEKMLTLCVAEASSGNGDYPPQLEESVKLGLSLYPDSYSLLAQYASLLQLHGDMAKARDVLGKALLIAPGKFHLWSRMAELAQDEGEEKLRISLLYRALNAPGQVQFKGGIYLSLARQWADLKAFGPALWELERFRNLYAANSWHLPARYNNILRLIPPGTQPVDPTPSYKRVEALADAELRKSLSPVSVTKTYHKNGGEPGKNGFGKQMTAWRVTDASGNNIWFQPQRFGIAPDLPIGAKLTVWIHNGKVVGAEV